MTKAAEDLLLVHHDGPVMNVTFNRPDHRNAVNGVMMRGIADAVRQATAHDCVVIRFAASGEDFSLGRDHAESPRLGSTIWTKDEWRAMTGDAFGSVAGFGGVTVAEVRGRAYGFGAALTTTVDVAIAADDARLAFDEVPMGFAPRRVMSLLFNRLGERRIKELVLTGRSVSAEEAHAIGIVTELAPAASLTAVVDRRVADLVSHDPKILRHAKWYLGELTNMTSVERPAYEGPSTF
ncbi:MAG TPA: enoyl-CoA hydratase/isomerase family protein [Acidimicrobiia bacterium]|nr:enoyl-CoA hydratase/isomerase family protein [Acidimicrobiia bacterium]